MKNLKILLTATLAVMTISLLAASAYAWCGGMGGAYGYGPYGTYNPTYQPFQPQTGTEGTTNAPQYYQPVYPYQFGGGCMGGFGYNNYGYGYNSPYTYNGNPIDIETAITIGQNYVNSIGNPDLAVKEVEEYSANFYVQVYEKSTGIGAFELLVNKYTGSIYPEMGPNMMWNTKYGMMRGGILGGIFGAPTPAMPISESQAETYAQQFLDVYYPGTTVEEATPFYGYYHVMVEFDGTPYGMLSVNGYTGQVWYHNWHGTFIQEIEVN